MLVRNTEDKSIFGYLPWPSSLDTHFNIFKIHICIVTRNLCLSTFFMNSLGEVISFEDDRFSMLLWVILVIVRNSRGQKMSLYFRKNFKKRRRKEKFGESVSLDLSWAGNMTVYVNMLLILLDCLYKLMWNSV